MKNTMLSEKKFIDRNYRPSIYISCAAKYYTDILHATYDNDSGRLPQTFTMDIVKFNFVRITEDRCAIIPAPARKYSLYPTQQMVI